jgi:1,2-diacylglycerol 3-alpha-glucosyltransferase
MRILLVSEVFYPSLSGVAVTVERLAAQMAKRGHEVTVVTSSRSRGFLKERRRGYTIYRIPSWPNPFRTGFRFTVLPQSYIRQVFAEVRPEVVHIHDPAMLCTAAVRVARVQGVPVVATNHFTYEYILTYLPWLKPLHPLITWWMLRDLTTFYNSCTVLTAPSKTNREHVQSKGKITVPVQVISNGVDIARFAMYYRPTEFLERYPLSLDIPVVTYVGRLCIEKNPAILLHALAKVLQRTEAQLVMVGSGELAPELHELAESLGIERSIVWIERLDSRGTLLNQLFGLTKVICAPSPVETESMVTLEALASGLPVVAANAGALPELVKDRQNGFLVDSEDSEAWATSIVALLEDEDLRIRMSRHSLETVAQRDLAYTMDAFERLYGQLIKEAGSAPVRGGRLPRAAD